MCCTATCLITAGHKWCLSLIMWVLVGNILAGVLARHQAEALPYL